MSIFFFLQPSTPQPFHLALMSSPLHSFRLNTGAQMPLLGLGTYRLQGEQMHLSVDAALGEGYRAFDTAAVYGNEADLGHALLDLMPKHNLTRADIFLISKLSPADMGSKAREGCARSLERLGLGGYIDLYLIHWPGTEGLEPEDERNAQHRAHSWTVMEELYANGMLRAIGVSNYSPRHLIELLETCRVRPAVLQVEFHPRLTQKKLRVICRDSGVCFQAYSSLGKGALLLEPEVVAMAEGHGRTPSQVLLRWAIQQGVAVLPRSARPKRVRENGQVFDFDLDEGGMERLSDMDSGTRFCKRDPTSVV
ncbi:aldo-keto reductase Mvan_2161-like isoform X1 [Oncorhynchus nerka]|uniref:aldo-keto reductase Mvan_2161-like isoform X1 n=2 Tax=Oncorhynchus TaxID=8016 RepID=UPI0031B8397E